MQKNASGDDARVLSRKQLLTICVSQCNEAIQITMPYTLAVFMVRDFQAQQNAGVIDEEEVGRNTGLLAACFCAAQFVSSFPLGLLSDRVGRKPMLIVSNVTSCASVILFGLSGRFWIAAFLRLLGGLFNCTFVCLKSMIGESCDTQAQARPLSILSLCWGLGTVIGPSLGGTLSQPCDTFGHHFPLCKAGQLLHERPFFLPCFIVGLVSLTAAFCSAFFVQETLPALVAKRYQKLGHEETTEKSSSQNLPEVELSTVDSLEPEQLLSSRPSRADQIERLLPHGSGQSDMGHQLARWDTPTLISVGNSLETERRLDSTLEQLEEGSIHDSRESSSRKADLKSGPSNSEEFSTSETEQGAQIMWYKQPQILLVIAGYVMICLLYNLLDEVTPIYGSADRASGGLAFTTTQLSVPIVTGGVSIFIWNLFFYPWYQRVLGVRNGCRLALLLSIPLAMLIGVPSLFSLGAVGLQTILAAVLFFKNICATNAFTSTVLMVNAVAPQAQIGAVNGASQASASFVRAVGPALGGYLWSFSIALPIPGRQMLAFLLTGAGYIFPLLVFSTVNAPQLAAPGK